jgi:hypothetical protein
MRRASTFNTRRIDHLYRDPHNGEAVRLVLHYGGVSSAGSLLDMIYPAGALRRLAPVGGPGGEYGGAGSKGAGSTLILAGPRGAGSRAMARARASSRQWAVNSKQWAVIYPASVSSSTITSISVTRLSAMSLVRKASQFVVKAMAT